MAGLFADLASMVLPFISQFSSSRQTLAYGLLLAATAAWSQLPAGTLAAGIATFALARFGCSALLPLTISSGQSSWWPWAPIGGRGDCLLPARLWYRGLRDGPRWSTLAWACTPCSGSRRLSR